MDLPRFPETFNLADYYLFARLDEGLGDKTAIRYGDRSWSYADIARRTREFSSLLGEADIRRGERVLIILPDTPPFAWVFFGTLRAACVVAMGNPESPIDQLKYLVD